MQVGLSKIQYRHITSFLYHSLNFFAHTSALAMYVLTCSFNSQFNLILGTTSLWFLHFSHQQDKSFWGTKIFLRVRNQPAVIQLLQQFTLVFTSETGSSETSFSDGLLSNCFHNAIYTLVFCLNSMLKSGSLIHMDAQIGELQKRILPNLVICTPSNFLVVILSILDDAQRSFLIWVSHPDTKAHVTYYSGSSPISTAKTYPLFHQRANAMPQIVCMPQMSQLQKVVIGQDYQEAYYHIIY